MTLMRGLTFARFSNRGTFVTNFQMTLFINGDHYFLFHFYFYEISVSIKWPRLKIGLKQFFFFALFPGSLKRENIHPIKINHKYLVYVSYTEHFFSFITTSKRKESLNAMLEAFMVCSAPHTATLNDCEEIPWSKEIG